MRIVAGSALQMSWERIRQLGISIVEYPLFVNGQPYDIQVSGGREAVDSLRALLKDKKNKVTTSGLRQEDLLREYQGEGGQPILSIHQSFDNTRATSAVLHQVSTEHPELDLLLFDTHHLTAAYSVQVLEAALALQAGLRGEELLALLHRNRANTHHLGALYDLFFLHRSGRLGLTRAILGTAMRVIPLLSSTEASGVLKSIGKVRTWRQANQRFVRMMAAELERRRSTTLTAIIAWCGPHEQEVEHLRQLILHQGWQARVETHYTNHSNMPHEGPDFYDIGYIVL